MFNLRTLVRAFFLASVILQANVEAPQSVSIPTFMNNSASCGAYLRFMPVYASEKAPGESHEEAAKRLIDAFKKGDLKIYQNHPDYKLKSFLSTGETQKQRESVAARLDGLVSDSQAKKKFYLVLEGEESINQFFADIAKYHQEVHSRMKVSASLNLNLFISIINLTSFAYNPEGFFKIWFSDPIMASFGFIVLSYYPYAFTTPLRLNSSLPNLMKKLNSERRDWIYSSLALKVSQVVTQENPALVQQNPDLAALALAKDYESVPTKLFTGLGMIPFIPGLILAAKLRKMQLDLGATIKSLFDIRPNLKTHVLLDHLYFWDEHEQKPVLIIGMRLYDKKPKNPKSAKQKESESSWAAQAEAAEG